MTLLTVEEPHKDPQNLTKILLAADKLLKKTIEKKCFDKMLTENFCDITFFSLLTFLRTKKQVFLDKTLINFHSIETVSMISYRWQTTALKHVFAETSSAEITSLIISN